MQKLDPKKPPPPDYYACNLRFLLEEVVRRSGPLLSARERAFAAAFFALDVPAQRLLARLVSRSGMWLRRDSLRYPEVGDVDAALHQLTTAGMVVPLAPAPADALLRLLTRQELTGLFPDVQGRTKPEWLRQCLGRYPDALLRARIAPRHPWLAVPARQPFSVCAVLFFGSDEADLSTFVIQDLGVRRYERYDLAPDTRSFATRRQLDRYLLSRRLAPWASRLDDLPHLARHVTGLLWPQPCSRTEQRARDGVLNRIGRWHERRGDIDAALTCYGRSATPPARERRARLLQRLGDEEGVRALLAAMAADPRAPEEADFARRFLGRKPALPARITTWTLRGATPPRIERHALTRLTANGGRGWHLENLLPLGLAGLAFWDVLFAPVDGAFSHPFQLGPQDLFWPDFARARRTLIEQRRRHLLEPGAFAATVRRTCGAKRGITNRLVHWDALSPEVLESLLAAVPHETLARLAYHVILDPRGARAGFPDLLLIYGPGAWELVEVKGPTDQLQPAQRQWLRHLHDLGIPARVLRLRSPS